LSVFLSSLEIAFEKRVQGTSESDGVIDKNLRGKPPKEVYGICVKAVDGIPQL